MVAGHKAKLVVPAQKVATAVGTSVSATLDWSRRLFTPALRKQVQLLPPSMRQVAEYHFGWHDCDGLSTNGISAGKAIRPALTLLSAVAVGGRVVDAVPAAVAVELVHNFSLLQDDVMDHDPVRRHRPTAWTVFGKSNAVLAGDALLALASCCLAPCGSAAVDVLSKSVIELCEGQSADLAFEGRDEVDLDVCWAMVYGKTASLFGCACQLGALVAGADAAKVSSLRSFGEHLGLAFQLTDDLLGIWGDPEVTGKPVRADLSTRKKSLPVVAALSFNNPASQRLRKLYRQVGPFDEKQLLQVSVLIEEAGGWHWAQRRAEEQFDLAMQRLGETDCESDAAARLRGLARLVTNRNH